MKAIIPYLNFDGTTREAMEFYKKCTGGNLAIQSFGEGATVTMPLADQFWGAKFGMLIDKFGVNWMFNCELPKQS